MSLAAFGCTAGASATAPGARAPAQGGSAHGASTSTSATAAPLTPANDPDSKSDATRTAEPKSSPEKHDDAYWLQRIAPQ
jgi:hypothetical protein